MVHIICSSGFYGAERVVANLIQTFGDYNMQALCLSPRHSDLSVFREQVTKKTNATFNRIPNEMLAALKELRRLRQTHGKIVIHAHGYKEVLIAAFYNLIHPTTVIVTQHGFTNRNIKSRIYNTFNFHY